MNSAKATNSLFETAVTDYLTRHDAGERPDPSEYFARYPDCETELRAFFGNLNFIDTKLAEVKAKIQVESERYSESTTQHEVIVTQDGDLPHIRGFRTLEEIGSGSQGVVYKAQQIGTRRIVALKVIREGIFASKRERRRFQTEVELASSLNHPNIVTVYACGQDFGRDFFAMEYIDGDALDIYLDRHTLDIQETLQLFLQICAAVHFAHQHGVIHRDLKPANVIVNSSGEARVLDFGLAKVISDGRPVSTPITQIGDFAGTWYYASPEQMSRAAVDVRTDVYALGVTLFEMLTDCYPYPVDDRSRQSIEKHILSTSPTRPSAIRREIDDDLDTIVSCALQKEPDRRYQSAATFADDVRNYLAGDVIQAKRDSRWYVLRKTIGRYRWQFLAGTTTVVSLIAFSIVISVLYSRALVAQATVVVRSRIVRRSQAYLTTKLDELIETNSLLDNIATAHPELPEIQALEKPVYRDPLPLLSAVIEDAPESLLEAVQSRGSPAYENALKWLNLHEKEIHNVVDICRKQRLIFSVAPKSASGFSSELKPGPLNRAERACDMLSAQALYSFRRGDHQNAIRSLDAVRSIAIGLGNGRQFYHKTVGVASRSRALECALAILNEGSATEADLRTYIAWILAEPPIVQYRLAMISQRQSLAQRFEAATFADTSNDSSYIDLDVFFRLIGGISETTYAMSDIQKAATQPIGSDEILSVLDAYFEEVEQWDDLDYQTRQRRSSDLNESERMKTSSAWPLLKLVLPQLGSAYKNRGRVDAQRSAALLSAHLCAYRSKHDRWPPTLAAAIANDKRITDIDPYIGAPFGYRLVEGSPVLYSTNEDGVDDAGKPGEWGEPGTDVVFFQPAVLGQNEVESKN